MKEHGICRLEDLLKDLELTQTNYGCQLMNISSFLMKLLHCINYASSWIIIIYPAAEG